MLVGCGPPSLLLPLRTLTVVASAACNQHSQRSQPRRGSAVGGAGGGLRGVCVRRAGGTRQREVITLDDGGRRARDPVEWQWWRLLRAEVWRW